MDVPRLPHDNDPIADQLAWARAQRDRVQQSWFTAVYGEDGTGMGYSPTGYWDQMVRTLEALQMAARLSRLLHGDCVELPSRDRKQLDELDLLHRLLLHQLATLITRQGPRHNVTGMVPVAVRAPPVEPPPSPPPPPPTRKLQLEEETEPLEEEQGGSCTIC
jgi:hypothetical protein